MAKHLGGFCLLCKSGCGVRGERHGQVACDVICLAWGLGQAVGTCGLPVVLGTPYIVT